MELNRMRSLTVFALAGVLAACSNPLRRNEAPPPVEMRMAPIESPRGPMPRGPDLESDPVLSTLVIAPPGLLSGPLFRTDPKLPIVGFLGHFQLETEYGDMDAWSLEMLEVRIRELEILAEIERIERQDLALQAARKTARERASAVGRVLSNPGDTIEGLPDGIGRYFRRQFQRAQQAVRDVSDRATHATREDDSAVNSHGFFGSAANDEPPPEFEERAKQEVGNFALNWIGYTSARREWAKILGADPYTSNPQLSERLDELTWGALAGSASVNLAIGAISGFAGSVVSASSRLDRMVWEVSPQELRRINIRRLRDDGLQGVIPRMALRGKGFSPTLSTELVDLIIAIGPLRGRMDVLELASHTETELEARFLLNTLRILIAWQERNETLDGLIVADALIAGETREGRRVLPMPVDHLIWNRDSRNVSRRILNSNGDPDLLIQGSISESARQGFSERGWVVQADYDFPGRPPYARLR